ncbi:hypothetical protein NPIL_188571 [Nephila pilipes]|uniref:Uncharacterized protein n=1 Tax=Nephila pilipes TaxID=299642 RepID=A0A8X6U4Q5_NEPPI|nr:hypothetical protein NPIL_188571 [Nephila pilipes]
MCVTKSYSSAFVKGQYLVLGEDDFIEDALFLFQCHKMPFYLRLINFPPLRCHAQECRSQGKMNILSDYQKSGQTRSKRGTFPSEGKHDSSRYRIKLWRNDCDLQLEGADDVRAT